MLCSVLLDGTFRIAGSPAEPVSIAYRELACELAALTLVLLLTSPMAELDLRRRRAQVLAVGRLLIGIVCCVIMAVWASALTTREFVLSLGLEVGSSPTAVPESELIISNTIVLACVLGLLMPFVGRLTALPFVAAVWLTSYAPVVFGWSETTWPLDYFQEPGPWFSLPHCAAAVSLLVGTLAVHWHYAGMSPGATHNENVGN